MTPSMSRRRAIRRATCVWPGAQPVIVIAGAEIALRSAPPWPPASVEMSPESWRRLTSCGMARERSRSACSQSKREPARSRTVCTRALAAASKSAYGLSLATCACIACCCWATRSRSALRCLMVLSVRTTPATPATQAASTPRTTNAPAPPLASGPTASSADDLDAPRVSGGRRLTALTPLVSAHARCVLNQVGRATLGPQVNVSRYQSTMSSPTNRPTRLPNASHGPNGMPFLRPSSMP